MRRCLKLPRCSGDAVHPVGATPSRGLLLVSASLGFDGWEYLSQVPDGFDRRGKSRQRNTHSTESREVRYPWHPWRDRMVTTHRSFTWNARALFCCSIEESLEGRFLEIPQWMFDPAICYRMGKRAGRDPRT